MRRLRCRQPCVPPSGYPCQVSSMPDRPARGVPLGWSVANRKATPACLIASRLSHGTELRALRAERPGSGDDLSVTCTEPLLRAVPTAIRDRTCHEPVTGWECDGFW